LGLMNNIFSVDYVLKVYLNAGIALLLGYLIWRFNGWSAGDAKLFTLFAFLIPLKFYSASYLNYFPSFALLVNTFLLILLFLMGEALFFGLKNGFKLINQPKNIKNLPWKKWLKPKNLKPKILNTAKMYLNYIAIFIVLRLGMQIMGQASTQEKTSNFTLIFLILFIARRYLFGFFFKSKKIMPVLSILGGGYAIYLISQGQGVLLFSMLKMALIFMVTIGLLMRFLGQYIEKKEVKKTFSFAPFMLLASLITIIIKGSLLSFILSLFR